MIWAHALDPTPPLAEGKAGKNLEGPNPAIEVKRNSAKILEDNSGKIFHSIESQRRDDAINSLFCRCGDPQRARDFEFALEARQKFRGGVWIPSISTRREHHQTCERPAAKVLCPCNFFNSQRLVAHELPELNQ
jgi:hypothetical protein